jgi:hypothetical protein
VRPVRRYEQLVDFDRLLARILEMRREGQTAVMIAATLNREGYRTPKARGDFTAEVVGKLLSLRGLINQKAGAEKLGRHERWLTDLARELRMSSWKLRDWAMRGWLHARQLSPEGLWVVWADRDEIKRLKKLRARSKRGVQGHAEELITPKKRVAK